MLPYVVLFQGSGAPNTQGLWETNGTASGTFKVTNGPFLYGFRPSPSSLMDLTVFNDQVLFAGRDTNFSYDLWTTSWNGAAFVTVDLNKTGAGITGAGKAFNPTDLTVFGAEVLFNGVDAAGHTGLWATNGTAPGTA